MTTFSDISDCLLSSVDETVEDFLKIFIQRINYLTFFKKSETYKLHEIDKTEK